MIISIVKRTYDTMRKTGILILIICMLVCILLGSLFNNSAYAEEVKTDLNPFVSYMNMFLDKYSLDSKQIVTNDYIREFVTVMLIMDYNFDDHSKTGYEDIAYLEPNCCFENDGMIIVLLKGKNRLDGASLILYYDIKNRAGQFQLVEDADVDFIILKESCAGKYGEAYNNDLANMLDISDQFGMNVSEEEMAQYRVEEEANTEYSKENKPSRVVSDEYCSGLLAFSDGSKWGYLGIDGSVAIKPQWDCAYDFKDGYAHVFNGYFNEHGAPIKGVHGIIDTEGNYVIPFMDCHSIDIEDDPEEFGVCITYKNIAKDDLEFEYRSIKGEPINNQRYSNSADVLYHDLRCVQLEEKWGYINAKTGKTVIDFIYDEANPFYDGIACVAVIGPNRRLSYFYIDEDGKTVIPNKGWDYADSFSENNEYTTVFKGSTLYDGELTDVGKYAIIDRAGNILCDYVWDSVSFSDDHMIYTERTTDGHKEKSIYNDQMELIEEENRTWDYMSIDSNGFKVVFKGTLNDDGSPKDGLYGYIDSSGNLICDVKWSDARGFYLDGYAVVGLKNKKGKVVYGVIDAKGNTVVEPAFDEIPGRWSLEDLFHDNLTMVKQDELYGYIDTSGQLRIEPLWDQASVFSEGLAVVWKGDKWRVINMDGNIIY